MGTISSLAALRRLIGEPNQQVPLKFHRQLNARAQAFIAKAPLLFLATADAAGRPCVSPKGDGPGFARVADDRTLLLPERKGNRLIFSLQNILSNPALELIFLVPGTGETLRVSGTAELLDDAELCAAFTERGRPALLVTRGHVTRAYFHCAKAFLRSALWDPRTWPDALRVSFGAEIAEAGGMAPESIDAFDAAVQERYRSDL